MTIQSYLISVIIPVFNGERYIKRSLDSILDQDLPPLEIIVVDDGSTDGTKKAVKAYGDRVKYIYQGNRGVSCARNIGIAAAQGEWIAFLDADDTWNKNKLSRQMQLLSRYPDAGMIFSAYCLNDAENPEKVVSDFSRIHRYGSYLTEKSDGLVRDCFYLLFDENFIKTSTVMIRKELFSMVGAFDEALKTVEDRDLFIRIAQKARVIFCNDSLVTKFVVEGSLGRENMDVINNRERVQEMNLSRFYASIRSDHRLSFIRHTIAATKWSRFRYLIRDRRFMAAVPAFLESVLFKWTGINLRLFCR